MKKKIFITIPWFLPAFRAGGPIQSIANLAREFQDDCQYYIFCGDSDLNGATLENIEINTWIPFNESTVVWYSGRENISKSLVQQVELLKPDIVFIIGMFSWHYNVVPLLFCKGPVKILSTRGMLHPEALLQKKWKKWIYLQTFKLLGYHSKVQFHATDEQESKYVRDYFGVNARVFVAGNFPNLISSQPLPSKEPGRLRLLTIALISPMKNILRLLAVLEHSDCLIDYSIYGPVKDEAYWDLCREKIKSLPENVKVKWHGAIEPQKVPAALQEAHVFILPSRSENFGHAIYEALAAGRPVITSHTTPWNDLRESKAGVNISLDTDKELSEALEFFGGMDESTLSLWRQGATTYAEKAIDIEKTKEEYRKMFFQDKSIASVLPLSDHN